MYPITPSVNLLTSVETMPESTLFICALRNNAPSIQLQIGKMLSGEHSAGGGIKRT
jgi:hypothetical protein